MHLGSLESTQEAKVALGCPWCIQVYFLLIKLMSVLLHRVVQEAFCDKKLLIHELLDFSLTSGVSCKLSDFGFY